MLSSSHIVSRYDEQNRSARIVPWGIPDKTGDQDEQFVVCYKKSESEGNVHFIWYWSAILSHRFLSAYSFDNKHQTKNADLKSINISVTLKYHRIPRHFMHKIKKKSMTSSSLMFPPQVNEIPPQKRGLTGATYTTPYFAIYNV